MCMMCSVTYATVGAGLLAFSPSTPGVTTAPSPQTLASQVTSLQRLPSTIAAFKMPTLIEPQWLKDQNAAELAAAQAKKVASTSRVVTYDVMTKGMLTASFADFRTQANATLNDGRGWSRMGVTFQEVQSGGSFTLVLSEASQVTSFSSGCGSEYSCRVGRYVIINQDRWQGATPSWNNAGGSLRDYRHMVVNHETGHWLGHGHASCSGAGQPAQVMQQQSIDLQGCAFNAWPTAGELWSSQLGITR
ncbi:MAG: rane protein [Candidatus Saccharibacteria bacterium]|nr:rane protein [Candidatus Saccharibacteria bacterium]